LKTFSAFTVAPSEYFGLFGIIGCIVGSFINGHFDETLEGWFSFKFNCFRVKHLELILQLNSVSKPFRISWWLSKINLVLKQEMSASLLKILGFLFYRYHAVKENGGG